MLACIQLSLTYYNTGVYVFNLMRILLVLGVYVFYLKLILLVLGVCFLFDADVIGFSCMISYHILTMIV